jgi:phosphatidylserine/phosphatidylglycerophosphate/cardiolipin synthase-like enzyme
MRLLHIDINARNENRLALLESLRQRIAHCCQRSTTMIGLHRVLANHAPKFPHRAADVRRIDTPREFFAQMIARVRRAERRVTLSSLYLGGGADSVALINAISEAKRNRPDIKVTLLFDLLRSARRDAPALPTTVEQVRSLVREHRADVYLHHNANAVGWAERFLPARWNELPGVHHMKLYIVDDDVCLSVRICPSLTLPIAAIATGGSRRRPRSRSTMPRCCPM